MLAQVINVINKSNIMDEVKCKLNNFINDNLDDLNTEGEMCLEMCDNDNDYHMTTYWISGTYDVAYDFLSSIKDKKELNLMIYYVKQKYPNDIEKLKEKVKSKNYNQYGLALEMLATILLKDYQKSPTWYTVYGCEQEDMADFSSYNIINALENQGEFPVMMMEDVVSAMYGDENSDYGVKNTVQSSDMYDVFAYLADELKIKKNQPSLMDDDKEYTFTPDSYEYEGIVYRWKMYTDIATNNKAKGVNLLSYLEMLLEGKSSIEIIREKYLNEFNNLKSNLFTKDNFIVKAISENELNILFFINGIENMKKIKKGIYNKKFKIPQSAQEMQNLVFKIAEDIKITLAGKEKERNKDVAAVLGLYPRKYLATHGLQFIKNLSHKNRELERSSKITTKLAEKQSLYIIKKTLRLGKEIALSCSFGADSILALYLMRKVKKDAYDIVFNNSLVEYGETIAFKNKIIKEWDLKNIVETLPVKSYWNIQKEVGWNFQDKGDRTVNKTTGKKSSASEQCCRQIKHEPMYNIIKERGYDSDFSGLRADESRVRLNASKRDGVYYYTKSFKLFKINPIVFWTNKMSEDYRVDQKIPYSEIYDKKLLDENGKVLYTPRTGCWTCMLNAKRNYLKWLKFYHKDQYDFLMINKGMAKDIYSMGMNIKINKPNNQISMFDNEIEDFSINDNEITDDQLEYYESLIERRPCTFLK